MIGTVRTTGTTVVGSRERDVLLVARAILEGADYEAVEGILRGPLSGKGSARRELEGLTAPAMRLLEDMLVKGCVRALARLGGWRREPRWTPAGPRQCRLWEACPTAILSFSAATFELCRWLVTTPLGGAGHRHFVRPPVTNGDELFFYLTCAWVEEQPLEGNVAGQPGIRACALAWLGFPRMLGCIELPCDVPAARFDALVADGGVLIAGLADDLAHRTVRFERGNAKVKLPGVLSRLGEARELVLGRLLDALVRARRWDLASFLVDATAVLVPAGLDGGAAAKALAPSLDRTASLRDREAARRAQAAFFRAVARLAREHEAARQVGFVDEGYDTAQLLLARWEGLGNVGFSRAAAALATFDALDQG